jgi:drug/metabolite transporter (DMT)-like permease
MPSVSTAYLIAGFCVVAIATGQLLFKAASIRIESLGSVLESGTALAFLTGAFAIYFVAALGWVVVLQRLPLSTAYLLMAIPFLLVPLAAHFVFGEPISIRLALGAAVVAFGIWIAVG